MGWVGLMKADVADLLSSDALQDCLTKADHKEADKIIQDTAKMEKRFDEFAKDLSEIRKKAYGGGAALVAAVAKEAGKNASRD